MAPSRLLLGETTAVSVHLSAVCGALPTSLHVVFAIGGPESMTTHERREVLKAARDLADHVLGDAGGTRLGVVGHDGAVSCNVTRDLRDIVRCLNRTLDPDSGRGSRGPEGVLSAAHAILRRGHLQHPAWSTREVVVLIATSPSEGGCPPWVRESAQLRGSSILVVTVGVGRSCDSRCLANIATSRRYAFCVYDPGLYQLFDRIRQDINNVALREVVLDYPLSLDVTYVTDTLRSSNNYGMGAYDAQKHLISWRSTYVPKAGTTVTFDVQPTFAGVVTLGSSATLRAIDTYRLSYEETLIPRNAGVFSSAPAAGR